MHLIFAFAILINLSLFSAFASDATVLIISGVVLDSQTGMPIEGATVSASVDTFPVRSDKDGRFKFIVLISEPIELLIHKEGYSDLERIIKPQAKVKVVAKLEPIAVRPVIVFSSFRRNAEIRGRVEGLTPETHPNYRILMYVLTDKWYIHPYAEDAEGRGYASIRSDGTWRIETVFRGYQAYRLAFLLVHRDTFPVPTVRVETSDPNQELLSRVNAVTSLIIDAPQGI